ncbi:MAG: DUF3871 family protein [Bacteroidota bacterium]
MEILTLNNTEKVIDIDYQDISTEKPFITANTFYSSYNELKSDHLIPVFVKDNQPVISQADLIEMVHEVTTHVFHRETILTPSIRVSHPIKGRIPEAKSKPAHLLTEDEKTIYYERMAFVIEIPSITSEIGGNKLSLTIGGIKAYNLDNLYSKKGSEEHFKIFIGFQNKVCTNMCISTDGYKGTLKVRNTNELMEGILNLLTQYNYELHLKEMVQLPHKSLDEKEFAQLIGRCRMYPYLSKKEKRLIPELNFGDTQLGTVVKDYFNDPNFSKNLDGSIDLWKLYNLFTGANKSSYIDTFFDRGLNAYDFNVSLLNAIENKNFNWFLS